MKKIAAILLLCLFLFNLVGYRWWFNYAQEKADLELAVMLDKHDYNDASLISIKVPLSNPYQVAQSGYERVDGEITIGSKIYKYVKRRVVNGELELLCLPDQNKMRLQNAKNDYFKTTSDIATNENGKHTDNSKAGVFKHFSPDYVQQAAAFQLSKAITAPLSHASNVFFLLLTSPHTPPGQPPDIA